MTFEQFQQSRETIPDLAAAFPDEAEFWPHTPQTGHRYIGKLWIADVLPTWPEAARKEGAFYLVLNNLEWIRADRAVLERILYAYALGEHIDATTEQQLIAEYEAFCAEHALPRLSADELIHEIDDARPDAKQIREWLSGFIDQWTAAGL